MGGKAQGAVAAQRHHCVDAERFQHLQHVAGAVALRHRARIAARGMEHGAAGPVDAAHALAGQLQAVRGDAGRIGGVDAHHPFPAAPEAGHLPAERVGREHDRADAGVEPGHIAAAGEDSDAHDDCLSAAAMEDNLSGRAGRPAAGGRAHLAAGLADHADQPQLDIDAPDRRRRGRPLRHGGAGRARGEPDGDLHRLVFGFAGLTGILVFASRADGGGGLPRRRHLPLGPDARAARRGRPAPSCSACSPIDLLGLFGVAPACSARAPMSCRPWRSAFRRSCCSAPRPISSKGSAGRAG